MRKQLRTAVWLAIGFAVMCGIHAWLGIYRLLWFMFFGVLGWFASTLDREDPGADPAQSSTEGELMHADDMKGWSR